MVDTVLEELKHGQERVPEDLKLKFKVMPLEEALALPPENTETQEHEHS